MIRLVEINGLPVHVVETGRADGTPLLLSSGLGGAWFDWEPVVNLLRDRHRIICFDRPGLGASPAGHRAAPSLRGETDLLARLAEWAGAPVMVLAHSVAAFHAEALARLRPDLVAGLVLVDPSCEGSLRHTVRMSAVIAPVARLFGTLTEVTGAATVIGPWAYHRVLRTVSRSGPVAPERVIRAVYGRGDVIGTVLAENAAYREMAVDLARLRGRRSLAPLPLVVLTALGDLSSADEARSWTACHAELAAMSPHGRQDLVADSFHMVQLDRPDAVADAVAHVTAHGARGVS
jgi:pimeloyl-ACP methyl ester carboxylesterase